MRTPQRRLNDEKQETELVIKLNGQVVFTNTMAKNLTMLDTIALAVSMTFLPVLLHGQLIEKGNLLQKESENE